MSCQGLTRYSLRLVIAFILFATSASAEWKEKVLYNFQGNSSDGAFPAGGVVLDGAGNLYGVTSEGGNVCSLGQCGIVFELSSHGSTWTETVLHFFQGSVSGDGGTPEGGLVIDSAGNLYGTTAYGGSGNCELLGSQSGCGTVFELSPPLQSGGQWTYTILYSFQGGNDGQFPWGNLLLDKQGNLFGATQFGGGKGSTCNIYYQNCGTVFELSPANGTGKWTEQVLYQFAGSPDGANPNGGLILDSTGNLYGTTYSGGSTGCPDQYVTLGCGTVFELRPPTMQGAPWIEKQLHVFQEGDDGALPPSGLVLGARGHLLGGAEGGVSTEGLIFNLERASGVWKETALYGFPAPPYSYYFPSLSFLNTDGYLYGATQFGPGSGGGGVFRMTGLRTIGQLSWLYKFKSVSEGVSPNTPITMDALGNIYGTTLEGGTGSSCYSVACGTVFELIP